LTAAPLNLLRKTRRHPQPSEHEGFTGNRIPSRREPPFAKAQQPTCARKQTLASCKA
jgi:hypothetical protein